jgi:hypothetical protein
MCKVNLNRHVFSHHASTTHFKIRLSHEWVICALLKMILELFELFMFNLMRGNVISVNVCQLNKCFVI